jgi:thiol-disulfide isomerase/thioredoxin
MAMASKRSYTGNVRAPEFPSDVEWLNVDRRLSLADLRGKLVLLDFWTYGCINCVHIIPDLKALEALYPDELVVIGVHSAKFANERDAENLRQIVLRYEIEHPVVNDRNMAIWDAYAVRAWPTTVLIDPRGYVIASHSGEGVLAAYRDLIAGAIREYDAQGVLDRIPLDLALESESLPETPLSFPGKVLAGADSGRLFIADSNHHRIIITDLDGHVLDVIGSGTPGLDDGPFDEARLNKPQGMALDGEILYIADTENHALRAADLRRHSLRTIVGDGQLTYTLSPDAPVIRLNSPWDLVLVGRVLYIAMAGLHQIWALDLSQGTIGPYAGSGREGLFDAPLGRAALAQPSGVTTDGQVLYFADSEASAVRVADLAEGGGVRTVIGEGLFEFGDIDGQWPTARLQHPLGITWHRDTLYVADTYNHKIKVVDPESSQVWTYLGSASPGWQDGEDPRFYEPGGISGADGRLYVADTNNHVIRVVDLDEHRVTTLVLVDPRGLLARMGGESMGRVIRLPEQRLRPGVGHLSLDLDLPEGYKVNPTASSRLTWRTLPDAVHLAEGDDLDLAGRPWPIEIDARFGEGRGVMEGDLILYYCAPESEAVCLIYLARIQVPLWVSTEAAPADASSEMRIQVLVMVPARRPQPVR